MKKLDRKLEKVKDYTQKIVTSKTFNRICLILGIFVIFIYFGFYMFKQPLVDEEVRPEVTNNLIPWEVKEGDNFLIAMATRPFNLNITELGQYRPRYLAFLVQFLDENIFLRVTRFVPIFGNRQPFYILAMLLTVLSLYYFIRNIWEKCPKGTALFISSIMLMFQNYQVATYWRARSAKLLALSACVFLITYIIKNLDVKLEKNKVKKILLSIPFFLLMTLDEQVLAIVVLLCGLSILFSIINKKVNLSSVITTISCLLYGSFHLWWGKKLFAYFTGGLQKHGHTIEGSINGISINTFIDSLKILKSTIPKIIFMSFWVFVIVWLYCFVKLIISKNLTKKERLEKVLISLFLAFAAVLLLMLMIDAHSAIYTLPCLWKSVYPLIATVILFMSLIYLFANVEFKYNFIKYILIVVGLFISLIYNINNISSYYGAYLTNKGGFMSSFTDLVVTKDNIKTEAVLAENMDIDNDSLIAELNTMFSTSNVKTTKILYGKYNNSNYLKKEFACYLIVRKNRKLNLKVKLEDYKKLDSISVVINRKKIATVPVDSNTILEELLITTEINRACKVKLIFNTKGESKLTKTDIKLEELYMR